MNLINKMKVKDVFKFSIIFTLLFLLISCLSNAISFDIEKQSIVSSNSKGMRNIYITNEINRDYYRISWEDSLRNSPSEINLLKIKKGYKIYSGWQSKQIEINNFKLKPNSVYIIERSQGDATSSKIKIWTNKTSNIYKSK